MTPEEQKAYDELKRLYEELQSDLEQTRKQIEQLKQIEPPSEGPQTGAMAPKSQHAEPAHLSAAQDAAATGKRTDLLRYMRIKRRNKEP